MCKKDLYFLNANHFPNLRMGKMSQLWFKVETTVQPGSEESGFQAFEKEDRP